MKSEYHIPAMLRECIEALAIKGDGVYADLTFGGGGHSRAILEKLSEESVGQKAKHGVLYSFDQDIEAYANRIDDSRWHFVHGNFRYLRNFMDYYGVDSLDGVLADLGVSFHHFDEAERGFSFRFDGPLDMRMNQQGGKTAADVVNSYSEEDLARVLWLYGEMQNSRAIARKIVKARGEKAMTQISELLGALGIRDVDGKQKKDLARLFQALRIEVNDELRALEEMLVSAKDLLKPGGRLVILTYHSLEDRIVKNFLRSGNIDGTIEKDFYGNILSPFRVIEKGRMADAEEVERNPRARSAKLRAGERI